MRFVNDKNFSILDYEMSLEYLYELSRVLKGKEKEDCIKDIEEIEELLENVEISDTYPKIENKRNKEYRKKKEYQKKQKLYKDIGDRWCAPVYEHSDGSLRYADYAKNTRKYYKRFSNKKLRRVSNKTRDVFGGYYIPRGNKYRRIFDYAWQLD